MPANAWLVTGASSGLGAHISIAALAAGHAVVACARNVEKAKQDHPDIEQRGGKWLTLDVTSPNTQAIVEEAVKEHGISVVVNNAGYALRAPLEDVSMAELRAQIETNVCGPIAVIKGALPSFRARGNGSTIVNISSTSGLRGMPGFAPYAASKFALEGASEALAAELAPFGVRVLIVEPGAYRTNFQGAAVGRVPSAPYKGTPADEVIKRLATAAGTQPGDPAKAATAIVEVVTGSARGGGEVRQNLRLLLGKDAVQGAQAKLKSFGEDVDRGRAISEWAVFEA